jgi:hypothetical protein
MNKLAWLGLVIIVACGGTNGGDDGGTDGSNNDATSNDASLYDASTKDSGAGDSSATDSSTNDAASDGGGLKSGDHCDPQNDLCGAGLKCCAGGAIQLDGGKNYQCATATDAGTCPFLP